MWKRKRVDSKEKGQQNVMVRHGKGAGLVPLGWRFAVGMGIKAVLDLACLKRHRIMRGDLSMLDIHYLVIISDYGMLHLGGVARGDRTNWGNFSLIMCSPSSCNAWHGTAQYLTAQRGP